MCKSVFIMIQYILYWLLIYVFKLKCYVLRIVKIIFKIKFISVYIYILCIMCALPFLLSFPLSNYHIGIKKYSIFLTQKE